MITILRILGYWLVMNGYFMFLKQKTNIKKDFIIPITFSGLILLLFLAGLLNILYVASILIIIGGILCYAYLSRYNLLTKEFLKEYFDYKTILFMVIALIFTIICSNLRIMAYDDFSHWSIAVKNLFLNDSLGTFEYNIDTFTAYPPGSSLFIYFFGFVAGKTESSMIIGQLVLSIGFLSSIMVLFDNKKKILSCILFVIIILFFIVVNNPLNSLMVDSLLGYISICSILIIYTYRDNVKECFKWLLLPTLILYLVKNSGLYFAALNLVLFLLMCKKNNKLKDGIRYTIVTVAIMLGIFVLWQCHLKMVYVGDDGVNSKHSLSIRNLGGNLIVKGPTKILNIAKLYLSAFVNYKNIIFKYILIFNIIVVALNFVMKKKLWKGLLYLDLIYLSYYICLGMMYIFSMPYSEAMYLACYNRYMFSLIFGISSILIIYFYNFIKENNKYLKVGIVLIVLVMGFGIFKSNYQILFGKDGFKGSAYDEVLKIKEYVSVEQFPNSMKYFYLKGQGSSCSIYRYVLRYAYMNSKTEVYCQKFNFNDIPLNAYVIVPYSDYTPFSFLDQNKFTKVNNYIYQKTVD